MTRFRVTQREGMTSRISELTSLPVLTAPAVRQHAAKRKLLEPLHGWHSCCSWPRCSAWSSNDRPTACSNTRWPPVCVPNKDPLFNLQNRHELRVNARKRAVREAPERQQLPVPDRGRVLRRWAACADTAHLETVLLSSRPCLRLPLFSRWRCWSVLSFRRQNKNTESHLRSNRI